jgi:hypothetical protein
MVPFRVRNGDKRRVPTKKAEGRTRGEPAVLDGLIITKEEKRRPGKSWTRQIRGNDCG